MTSLPGWGMSRVSGEAAEYRSQRGLSGTGVTPRAKNCGLAIRREAGLEASSLLKGPREQCSSPML